MNRDKFILGIHIDGDFLNIVHLGQSANGLQVHSWTAKPLEEGIVKDGLIADTQAVSQKIRNFIKANKLKHCKAVMSMPISAVRLKSSEFPTQSDEQLQKKVEEQIGKYALFGGEKIVFDYCVFDEANRSSGKQIVLQAVTTRQISDACLAVARGAGLDLLRVEPAILPIMKLACGKPPADSQAISLLLALDSASANLSVFKNGLPQLCQNLGFGVKDLSQDNGGLAGLTEQMKPVLDFAHSLVPPLPGAGLAGSPSLSVDGLGSQQLVLKVAAACSSEELGAIVRQIKQSVPVAELVDVAIEQIDQSQIAQQFGVQGTDGGEVPIFALTSVLMAFGVCEFAGQLNLISKESLTMQRTQKEMSLTAKAIAAVILLSIAALVPLKMKIKSLEAASANLEAKVTETLPMSKKIADIEKQLKQLKEKLSAYVSCKQLISVPWPKAIKVIGDTVPDGVRIVDIATDDSGNFTLIGEALAESYVYRFTKRLQNTEILESAKVEEIEYDDDSAEDLVDYKITCRIRLPESATQRSTASQSSKSDL